jgi:Tfp pilus assembly protein PilO
MTSNTPVIKKSYQRKDFGNPLIQIILLAVICSLFSWFILKPKYSETMANRSQLSAAEKQLEQITKDQADLKQLVSRLNSSTDQVALVDEALPLNGRISKANVLMESLVQASGMSMAQLTTSDSQKTISSGDKAKLANPFKAVRTLNTISMTLSLTGNLDQFRNLLELIETNGRVLDVESMDVTSDDNGSKFRIIVNAYAFDGGGEGEISE